MVATDDAVWAVAGAVAASVAVLLVTSVVLFRRRRSRSEAKLDVGPSGVEPVVELAAIGNARRWRLLSPPGAPPVTIDVFSFRVCSGDWSSDWRHELMDEPLHLAPGHTQIVGAAQDPNADYDIFVGWVAHHAQGDVAGSRRQHVLGRTRPPDGTTT